MILLASKGTARSTMPQSQLHNIMPIKMATGLRSSRRPRTYGVTTSAESRLHHVPRRLSEVRSTDPVRACFARRRAEFHSDCDRPSVVPPTEISKAIRKLFQCRALPQNERKRTIFEHSCHAALSQTVSTDLVHGTFQLMTKQELLPLQRLSLLCRQGDRLNPSRSQE